MLQVWKGAAETVRVAIAAAADCLVPPLCLACHRQLANHNTLCASCWTQIDFIRAPVCDRLGVPLAIDIGPGAISAAAEADPPEYDRARAVARFDGIMRNLVHDLKFRDRQDGLRLFGRLLASAGGELLVDADAIVPVPLTRWRLLHRRFNQSAVLAQEVSRITERPYWPMALARTRRTRPQVGLSRAQRRENVAGAFTVAVGVLPVLAGAKIVLVDDVITTGATVRACARVLKAAGAARVDVLSLAMVTDAALLPP